MTPQDEMADDAAARPDPDGFYLTKGDDVFYHRGQPYGSNVHARAGDDELHGAIFMGGMYGGEGNDTIYAGFEFFDKGGAGDDLIFGSAETSRVMADHLYGGAGDDHIVQRNASSYIWGGSGDDTIELGFFASIVKAGSGDDVVSYWSTAQIGGKSLDLGSGDDVVDGSASFYGQAPTGTVFTHGRGGDDLVIAGVGADVFDGGHGVDGVSYAFETAAVTVDLKTGVNGGAAAADILESVENVTGTAFDDSLTGNGRANVLVGGAGADTIHGGGGDDWIYGGAGADVLKGGSGANVSFCDVFDKIVDFNPDEGDVRINVPTTPMAWDQPDDAAPDDSRDMHAHAHHVDTPL